MMYSFMHDLKVYNFFYTSTLRFLFIFYFCFLHLLTGELTNQSLTSNPPFLDHQLLCFGCTTIKSLAFSYCCPPMHIAMMMLKLLVVILFLYFIFLFSIANGIIITYPFLCINSV